MTVDHFIEHLDEWAGCMNVQLVDLPSNRARGRKAMTIEFCNPNVTRLAQSYLEYLDLPFTPVLIKNYTYTYHQGHNIAILGRLARIKAIEGIEPFGSAYSYEQKIKNAQLKREYSGPWAYVTACRDYKSLRKHARGVRSALHGLDIYHY